MINSHFQWTFVTCLKTRVFRILRDHFVIPVGQTHNSDHNFNMMCKHHWKQRLGISYATSKSLFLLKALFCFFSGEVELSEGFKWGVRRSALSVVQNANGM